MKATVGLVQGESRYENVTNALNLIADQISFQGRRSVVIKPNLVLTREQLPSTRVEAIRAVLDFVRSRYEGPVTIAEGSGLASTWEGYRNFGYMDLVEAYQVKLVDMNADKVVPMQVYDRHLQPRVLRMARTVLDSDLRISVGPPKTHDAVIVTLSIKNMIMGSLVNRMIAASDGPYKPEPLGLGTTIRRSIRESEFLRRVRNRLHIGEFSDKMAMHQSYPVINLNLGMLAPWVRPHLAVIDGFQAMEGAGPLYGDPVDWRIALAGVDALAVDSLTASLMGFEPGEAGYLHYAHRLGLGVGDLAQIEVLGTLDPDSVRRQFKPHPRYQQQLQWYLEEAEALLQPAPQGEEALALTNALPGSVYD